MLSLAYSLASCLLAGNLSGYHALASHADSSTLHLAVILAALNR